MGTEPTRTPRPTGPRGEPPPCLIVVGVLAADVALAEQAVARFAGDHGGLLFAGARVPFERTRYYEAEMGVGLQRYYCACGALVAPDRLPALKWAAWDLEQEYARDGRRRVNLDPGVLDFHKLVLATFKDGPEKIHLGRGVFAQLALFWEDGRYGPLPWSFPDLRGGEHDAFFLEARARYKALLREHRQRSLTQSQSELVQSPRDEPAEVHDAQ